MKSSLEYLLVVVVVPMAHFFIYIKAFLIRILDETYRDIYFLCFKLPVRKSAW